MAKINERENHHVGPCKLIFIIKHDTRKSREKKTLPI